MQKIKLGILGASGNVGQELLDLLESWPTDKLPLDGDPMLFGTARSKGKKITFRGQKLEVKESLPEYFAGLDVLVSAANGEVSATLVPEALKKGVKLIVDTDSYYRMDDKVPLVTIGVNDEDIDWHQGIIASPNCSTAQLILPLGVLHKSFGLKRVVVSTYQSVSGAGKTLMDQLLSDSHKLLSNHKVERLHDEQVAFNLIPMISKLLDNGYSKEEWKVLAETRKMLKHPTLGLSCTAVRVPTMIGHCEAANIELERSFSLKEIHQSLQSQEQIQLWTDPSTYPTPLDVERTQPVHVARVRIDESQANTIDMWIAADNLWIGAALNALRIVEAALDRNTL